MKEVWKDVPSYEEFYSASNTGRVYSKRQQREIKGSLDNGGYYTISLYNGFTIWKQRRSRIVYRTFKGELSEFDLIHHKDENKLNDSVSNLEKTTRSSHKLIHNSIGERTRFQIKHLLNEKEIIALYENHTTTEIAKMKGCHQKTVERLIKRVTGSLYNHYRSKKVVLPFSET